MDEDRLKIVVQTEHFDAAEETRELRGNDADIGAVVAFTGYCRDEGGSLAALVLEHYPGMAEAEIERIARRAAARWAVTAITVVHRFGRLQPGDPIVLVLTASRHRQAAFHAAEYLMDFLKSQAPFWKREIPSQGKSENWVAASAEDENALNKWDT